MKLKNIKRKEKVWVEDIVGANTTDDSGCLLHLDVEVERAGKVGGEEDVKLAG